MLLLAPLESSPETLPILIGAAIGLLVFAGWRYRQWTRSEPEVHGEFEDLQFSLGAEPAAPDVLALKDAEISALTERLIDLESLGHRIAHIEKRHLAERERLEKELLEATLEAEEKKSYERRWKAIRTRYRNLKARLDELPEGLDQAEGELEGTRKDLERSEKRAESLKKEVDRVKQRLTRRDAMLEKTKDRLEKVLADNEKHRDRAAQLRQEQVESKRELRELKQELGNRKVQQIQAETPRPVDLMRKPKEDEAAAPEARAPKKKSGSGPKKTS